jgi:hypothetical protein
VLTRHIEGWLNIDAGLQLSRLKENLDALPFWPWLASALHSFQVLAISTLVGIATLPVMILVVPLALPFVPFIGAALASVPRLEESAQRPSQPTEKQPRGDAGDRRDASPVPLAA